MSAASEKPSYWKQRGCDGELYQNLEHGLLTIRPIVLCHAASSAYIYTRAVRPCIFPIFIPHCLFANFITDCPFANTMDQYLHLFIIILCNLFLYVKLIGKIGDFKHDLEKQMADFKHDLEKQMADDKKKVATKQDLYQNLNEFKDYVNGQINTLKDDLRSIKDVLAGELGYFKKNLIRVDNNCRRLSKAVNFPITGVPMQGMVSRFRRRRAYRRLTWPRNRCSYRSHLTKCVWFPTQGTVSRFRKRRAYPRLTWPQNRCSCRSHLAKCVWCW